MKLIYRLLNDNDFDKGYGDLINKGLELDKKDFNQINKDLTNTYYTIIHVCEDISKGLIVGTCSMTIFPLFTASGRGKAILEDLIIHPKYENTSIRKELVNFLIKLAIYKNCFKISVNCKKDDSKFFSFLGLQENDNVKCLELKLDDLIRDEESESLDRSFSSESSDWIKNK